MNFRNSDWYERSILHLCNGPVLIARQRQKRKSSHSESKGLKAENCIILFVKNKPLAVHTFSVFINCLKCDATLNATYKLATLRQELNIIILTCVSGGDPARFF